MKNRNFRTLAAFLIVFAMLFSMATLVSAESKASPVYTTAPGPTNVVPSTAPSGEIETTNGSYDDGYNAGYDDGYDSGFSDGYQNGWYDGFYNGQEENKDIFTIIRERIEEIRYNIQNFYKNLEKKIKEALGISDIDKNYLPSADIENLGEDTEALNLCMEFNEKAEALQYPEKPISYVKTAKVGIEIVDCTGGKLVAGIVNPIVEDYLVDEVSEYEYEQDYATGMQSVYVNPRGLKSATKTVNDDGTTDYEFVLIEESTFFDGEDDYILDSNGELSYGNFYNYDVADVLMMYYFDADPVKIKKATIHYPGTTIKAKADEQGRLITLDILMPVEGSGTASLYLMTIDVEAKGYRNEGFTITYPEYKLDIDPDIVPDGSEKTLQNDAEAIAVCEEFNGIYQGFRDAAPDNAAIKRTMNLDAEAIDTPSVIASIINPIIDNFSGESVKEETVEKGDISSIMNYAYLDPAGLTVAEKTVNEDGSTDYKFVLAKETSLFDGNRTYGVRLVDGEVQQCDLHHDEIGKAIYLEYLDLSPVEIRKAQISYSGATITAKTDVQGRLVSYNVITKAEGSATGKAGFVSATISLSGTDTDSVEIIYS